MGDEDSGPAGPLLYNRRTSFDPMSLVFGLVMGATFTLLGIILVIVVETSWQ